MRLWERQQRCATAAGQLCGAACRAPPRANPFCTSCWERSRGTFQGTFLLQGKPTAYCREPQMCTDCSTPGAPCSVQALLSHTAALH